MTPEEEYLHVTRIDPPMRVRFIGIDEVGLAVNYDWPNVRVKCSDGTFIWTNQMSLEIL